MNIIDFYYEETRAAFERAFAVSGHCADYIVGGQRWRVRSAGDVWATRYLRAIAHLRVTEIASVEPDLTVDLWDTAETEVSAPAPSWEWARRLPHSYHSEFDHGRCAALLYTGLYLLVDRPAKHAFVWHPRGADLPQWDFAAPLRDLIELWFKPAPITRVHAGAVGTANGGALLVGKSGSGKSTTTIACLQAGLSYLGDDYVLIDPEHTLIHSLYNSGKLTPDTLSRFPDFAPHISNRDSIETFKAILYFDTLFPDHMVASLPLKAILIPTVTHQPESQLVPVSPVTALHALAPSTLFQAADPSPHDFTKISHLVRTVPAFRLLAGNNFDQLTGLIKDHLRHA